MPVLRRLERKKRILNDFYVFDLETGRDVEYCDLKTREQKTGISWELWARPEAFKFACIYGPNYNKVFYNLKDLHNEFKQPRFKNRIIFAHNFGRFDGLVISENIFKLDPHALFNKTRFISCSNGNCTFGDSTNIFVGQSVEKIGLQLGNYKPDLGETITDPKTGKKIKMMFSPDGIQAPEINRCMTDCQIVWEALFRSFEFAGDIKLTQASLSLTYFRRTHQQYDIEHNENTSYFWDSYLGGRCEMFKQGPTHSGIIDVNSMYPECMRNTVFPNPKTLKVDINVTITKLERLLENYEGLIYADIRHDKNWFGLLPVKQDGKLMFPIGNISGCWNFNEFRFAYNTGKIRIKAIKKVVYSERMRSPFVSYVDELFRLKLEAELIGDEFMRDLYKRFANSLYGKTAQRIDEETIYIEDMEKQYQEIEDYKRKGLFKEIQIFNAQRLDCYLIVGKSKAIKPNYSIPSFASYITSAARVKLMQAFMKYEKNRITYCDTDSIAMEIMAGVESSNKLGEWKIENKIITKIYGLKNYRFIKDGKNYRRLKGVPEKALTVGENVFKYFNLMGQKEAIRRNREPGILTERNKTITGIYDKRIILAGGETKPIEL